MTSPPGWVLPGAVADYDFVHQLYWMQNNPTGGLFSIYAGGTTPYYVQWSDGHVTQVVPGGGYGGIMAVTDLGLQMWIARSNLITSTNDLTNAAWTATNMTVALNKVGPDLVLNSASLLTATAANATISQAVTAASNTYVGSMYVKAVNVTGAVSMSIDGGATYTAVTMPTTPTGWGQVQIPSQALTNPTVIIKIANSGDSIAVWCGQLEAGAFASPPMPTGYTTRGAPGRVGLVGNLPIITPPWTILAITGPLGAPGGKVISELAPVVTLTDASNTSSTFTLSTQTTSASTFASGTVTGSNVKRAASFDGATLSVCGNAGNVGTVSQVSQAITSLYFGSSNSGTTPINGAVRRVTLWNNLQNLPQITT